MGLPSVLFGTHRSFRINRPQEGRRGGVDSSPFVPLETSRALGTCLAERRVLTRNMEKGFLTVINNQQHEDHVKHHKNSDHN